MKPRGWKFYLRMAAAAVLLAVAGWKFLLALSLPPVMTHVWSFALPAFGALCLLRPDPAWVRNASGGAMVLLFASSLFRFFHGGSEGAGLMGSFGLAVLCLVPLIIAGMLFSPTLTRWASRPFTALIDSVYFGSGSLDAPPVTLRLAQAYRQAGRYEDAIDECERQLEWHPRSPELWAEIVRNARLIRSGEEAAKYFRHASRQLRRADREMLAREFPGLAAH